MPNPQNPEPFEDKCQRCNRAIPKGSSHHTIRIHDKLKHICEACRDNLEEEGKIDPKDPIPYSPEERLDQGEYKIEPYEQERCMAQDQKKLRARLFISLTGHKPEQQGHDQKGNADRQDEPQSGVGRILHLMLFPVVCISDPK